MLAPYPSTVPMRVSVAMSGSGTPARMRKRACSTLGNERSHHSSGTSISSVAKRSQFCSPHAAMAGHPEPRPGRDVAAVVVEAAVAAHAAGEQRLGDRQVGQELLLGELAPVPCPWLLPPVVILGVYCWVYTVHVYRSRASCCPGPSDAPPSCTVRRRPSPRPGFADTSMEDVAAACGVTKLIVYRHFGSKEELYREILQQVFDDLGQELRSELAVPTPAADSVPGRS